MRTARTRACIAIGRRSPPPDGGILRPVRRRACLVLGLAGAAAVLPAPASADVTLTDFKVEPASTQGGGHPDVTITQTFEYTNGTDSVKDGFVRLQPGLLGNPQAAGFCSQEQFSADSCPADSTVGSVQVTAHTLVLPFVPLTNTGVVYNLTPTGDEPARVGIVVEAALGLSKIFLQAPVYVRPGPDGYGLESTFADQPRTAGVDIQIEKIALTFNGMASKGPFMRMPTSCAEGTSLSRANSWEAPTLFSEKTFAMTPTGCESLPFTATAEGSMGAPGITHQSDFPPVSTTLKFDPEGAALKRAEVILPLALGPNLAGAQRACPRALADASNCPDSSRVGTAIIDSPLQAQPVRGPVYIAFNTDNPLGFPGLMVILPPPVGVRLDGVVEPGTFGTKNTFAANPDLPVRSFTLEFDGGRPDSILTINQDLCAAGTDRTMEVHLVAHNGKEVSFSQELATPACDPRAKFTITRKGERATLVARLRAGQGAPGIEQFGLRLPKTLARGKVRPFVLADGQRMRPLTRRRLASMRFPGEVRSATLVWRGLRAGRRLRRIALVRLSMRDANDHTTFVKRHVRVRGKIPRRR
jgi:hypothetical protein